MNVLCKKNNAFTITELLVVIAIIGILVAIIMPVASKWIEKSNDSKCLSNLRQIGVALKLYANENNDTIVPAFSSSANPVTWQSRLDPYLGLPANTLRSGRAWQCPRFLKFPGTPNRPSYVVNYNLTMFTQPKRFVQLPQGRRFILVMENYNINQDWFNQSTLQGLNATQLAQVFRHPGSSLNTGTSRVLWNDLSISDATFNEVQANRSNLASSLWIYE